MKKYVTMKIGMFRSTSNNGHPVKTYVYYVEETNGIAIKRYAYGADMTGWEPIKKFKDKWLYEEQMHLYLKSLATIQQMVNIFLIWNTEVNQTK